MSTPIYAVGDIHGQFEDLCRVLDLIAHDGGPEARVVFLGDYTDRGPDSRGVVQLLMEAQAAGRPWTMIKGNHDRYLTRFIDEMRVHDPNTTAGLEWFNPRLGGDKTLASYGVTAQVGEPVAPVWEAALEAVPQDHLSFLKGLPTFHTENGHIFVHAGLRPGIPLAQQAEDDLLWIRKEFLEYQGRFEKLVVHGHTALTHPCHHGNRVNLDGGAGYFRPLHAAVFEADKVWLLNDAGRVPLLPDQ